MKATLAAVVVVVALVGASHWSELKAAVDEGVMRLREAGPVVFFLGMALLPAFGFPLMPFSLAAGPVFGPTMGAGPVIACAIGAVMINVGLSYWLAARALRPLVARLAELLGYRLPVNRAETAWQITTIVRVAPGLPFFMQSYLLGLTRVPFGPYLTMSTLIPAAYLTAIILGGNALWEGKTQTLLIALGLLGLVGAIVHLTRKLQAAKAAQGGVAGAPPLRQVGTDNGLE
jgi:uncharacterized membrane protein YdjX (TVP38/TMEM64 family)